MSFLLSSVSFAPSLPSFRDACRDRPRWGQLCLVGAAAPFLYLSCPPLCWGWCRTLKQFLSLPAQGASASNPIPSLLPLLGSLMLRNLLFPSLLMTLPVFCTSKMQGRKDTWQGWRGCGSRGREVYSEDAGPGHPLPLPARHRARGGTEVKGSVQMDRSKGLKQATVWEGVQQEAP